MDKSEIAEVARLRATAYWAGLTPEERKEEMLRRTKGIRDPKAGFQKGHTGFRTKESYARMGKKLSKIQKGRKFSEEHKRNISKAKKGRPLSEKTKQRMLGRIPWNKGKPLTEEHRQKLKVARKELREHQGYLLSPERRRWISENQRGENHPNWLGGKSFEPYGLEFNGLLKRRIRGRDNYTCQICGCAGNGRKLDVHHIDYDKKNNSEDNLVCLCSRCHGKTNFNRGAWKAYFKELLDGTGNAAVGALVDSNFGEEKVENPDE